MASLKDAGLVYGPFSGRVSVYLFGRPLDWNIAGDESPQVLERLGALAKELGLRNIYAPRASLFNTIVCLPQDLKEAIPLPGSESRLWRGCDADGTDLASAGDAFWISSADCITVVTHDPSTGKTVASHAGRDCLVDRNRIAGKERRRWESVVHAIDNLYSENAMKRLRVFMTCGIAPDHFSHPCNHPEYGNANVRMVFEILRKWGPTCVVGPDFEGNLCLSEIVRAQFLKLGVQPHNIAFDGVDTYSDLGQDGCPKWWSHRRGDGKKRNGVLVVRHW